MFVAPVVLVDTPAALRPEQRIAVAVVRQAILDATSPLRRPHARRAAALFFSENSSGLRFWAEVLGIDASVIGARCRHRISAQRERPRITAA